MLYLPLVYTILRKKWVIFLRIFLSRVKFVGLHII